MNKRVCSSFYGCIVLLLFPVCGQARETVNFDFDWKFKLRSVQKANSYVQPSTLGMLAGESPASAMDGRARSDKAGFQPYRKTRRTG